MIDFQKKEVEAKILFSTGNYDLALRDFKILSEFDPHNGHYYFYQGNCQILLKNFEEAEHLFTKALASKLSLDYIPDVYQNRGFVRMKLGDNVGANLDKDMATNSKNALNSNNSFLYYYVNQLTKHHSVIVNFFKGHKFGAHPPLMTYFSTLHPKDRCTILEIIFNLKFYHNYDIIIDKLMLAYCKDENTDGVNAVIDLYKENGTRQEMLDHLVYLKQNFGAAPYRSDEERLSMFQNYKANTTNPLELEFLSILKSFVINSKIK